MTLGSCSPKLPERRRRQPRGRFFFGPQTIQLSKKWLRQGNHDRSRRQRDLATAVRGDPDSFKRGNLKQDGGSKGGPENPGVRRPERETPEQRPGPMYSALI